MKRILCLFLTFLVLSGTLLTACSSGATLEFPEETRTTEELKTKETTSAPVVTEKKEQKDPSTDYFLNVLIIGNSFSTGWPDELNGLMTAAGIKVNLYTVYYSGDASTSC